MIGYIQDGGPYYEYYTLNWDDYSLEKVGGEEGGEGEGGGKSERVGGGCFISFYFVRKK